MLHWAGRNKSETHWLDSVNDAGNGNGDKIRNEAGDSTNTIGEKEQKGAGGWKGSEVGPHQIVGRDCDHDGIGVGSGEAINT